MKKMLFTSTFSIALLIAIGVALINQPTHAFNNPPMFISCHHEVSGVMDPMPYAMVQPPQTCPPWSAQPEAPAVDGQINAVRTANGLPPHLCKEIGLPEW